MLQKLRSKLNQLKDTQATNEEEEGLSFSDFIIKVLGTLLAIPVYILLYRFLPDFHSKYHLDKILLFIAVIFLTQFVLKLFKRLVVYAFFLSMIWLSVGSYTKGYGFINIYHDYRDILFSLVNSPNPEKVLFSTIKPFPNKTALKMAVDYTHPAVRDFALSAVSLHFKEFQVNEIDRVAIQSMAIFKEIQSRWNYVSDPTSEEYFAKASESVKYLSGDCDDHATFMAACLKAIGASPRFIRTTKHIYPELLVGDMKDLNHLNYLIRNNLFPYESFGKNLFYHTDEAGKIWINMDYTANYPGGQFMAEEVEGVLEL